ncbi:uncharacterized protein B0H18DRAFT_1043850 [Fomitopsis serialis]|uniref:uncharacterized protein n=1 Tax=Fomitopsis serialis TaxID=139415 RepID=UPI002007D602|nr:uncharacterized protein B0H18DRAFT_1043850 [Neoantrodia serialis]KAH9914825.1 hypothetical protein B0H18DRAFT_1043850 [Neoantrodia serialis]
MIPLHRTLARSPSTPLQLPSPQPAPHLLAPSASFDSSHDRPQVLSPLEVARISYFPSSASASPKLGMNTPVRFVRPGRPSASLDVQPAYTASMPSSHAMHPPPFERFQFSAAFRDRANIAQPTQPPSRTRLVLNRLKARTSRLPRKLGLSSGRSAHLRPPRVPSDPELAFQDEQHRKHLCWRCRKAGGRQTGCRAFKTPASPDEMVKAMGYHFDTMDISAVLAGVS